MKKKIIIFILSLSMLSITACGSNESSSLQDSEQSSTETVVDEADDGTITLDFYFGTRTGVYSGETNEEGLPDGTGTFTSVNDEGDEWSYSGDWVNGHWNGYGVSTWSNGQTYTGEYVDDTETGSGKYVLADGTILEGNFLSGSLYGSGTIYMPDGSYFEGEFTDSDNGTGKYYDTEGICYSAVLENGEITKGVVVYDFFGDEDRQQQYEDLYESYQFSDLYDYVNEYVLTNDNGIVEQDSAYEILEVLESVKDYQDMWTVEYDEFDSSYSVIFEGATDISDSNSVAVTVSGTSFDVKIGFRKSGWLFFDRYYLSIDGEESDKGAVKSYDSTRTVISGNTIEEYAFVNFSSTALKKLDGAETVILRFENDDSQEYYDHTLTDSEKNALYYGMLVQNAYKDLKTLLSDYQRAVS